MAIMCEPALPPIRTWLYPCQCQVMGRPCSLAQWAAGGAACQLLSLLSLCLQWPHSHQ